MGECLEKAMLLQILADKMKKKSIVEKTKRWVCNNIYTFYGPRFVTYQPMVEKVPQIWVGALCTCNTNQFAHKTPKLHTTAHHMLHCEL